MTETAVNLEVDTRGVATVTLQRASKHNAFDDTVIGQLQSTFTAIGENPDVRIMVLAAEGKSFSAGADLNWMQRMANYSYEENLRDARSLAIMLHTLNTLPIPTIARVQGAAFGGAVGLVGCCDIAIASRQASFCLSEVRIGLIPATISPYVIAAMGERAARRYFLSAERFSAETACQSGLVSEVVDAEQLDQCLNNHLDNLLNNSPSAMREAKILIRDMAGRPVDDALIQDTSERIAEIRVSKEGQEGLQAFLEKRQPSWKPNNV